MKKFIVLICSIIVFLFLFGCGNSLENNEADTGTENNNSSDLVEDSNTEQEPKEVVCSCPNCQYPITLGDAIVIAQTHFFAVYYSGFDSSKMVEIVELLRDDSENWYINIVPRDVVNDGDEYIYKGQSYVYTISKENGTIIEIDASGE